MAAAAAYYTRLGFTHRQPAAPAPTEWEAVGPTGTEMSGITVLTRNPDGLVETSPSTTGRSTRPWSSHAMSANGPPV
jgi:hypothetical protein